MSDAVSERRTWGRIGGLKAWAVNPPETMVGPAHRGFAAKFERLVIEAAAANGEPALTPNDVATRADRLRRAHMLDLAARSAAARRRDAA